MTKQVPAASAVDLADRIPYNPSTAAEHGDAARTPPPGVNPNDGSLQRVRADASEQRLSTNQGVPVADNQNSLKSSLRGPTLMEDFILREKITHFDHERIPERIVHARGSAAHGYFESYQDLSAVTRAAPFALAGKRTPVFVRFSTVAGERGSPDTVRDVRGFAVKFYSDEGNWDLVGNNIPVFFIQDAMKFPDLVHAVKPEPHNGMPQAASAHDTFWDFTSLMPESMHMLMWVMSDRAIPRSYRMMQGFGVHTFRLVSADGASVFVKFHWLPLAGTHSLVWDEAMKVIGADPDYHRRDLWEAIEAGNYPQWELALQTFTEEQAAKFPFDVLDATKIVPEELAPLQVVGRMTLNRNPDNFFAETEQVAFCAAHIIPGIDFTNDPLLQGRIHSYMDTQISRLGGPNFHEIPINTPVCPVHNNQRDGMHRQTINRGRVAYEPNSLGGGCPFQAGTAGFTSLRSQGVLEAQEDKVRGKPELFADHYSQARLFWQSQTRHEQNHIANGFRFELSKVTIPAIRLRMLSMLANVDDALALDVADALGLPLPPPQPLATDLPLPSYPPSPALSLMARPGEQGIRTRQVAILVADGVDGDGVRAIQAALEADGAAPHLIAIRLGTVTAVDGSAIAVERTLENAPGVLFDAVAIPCGEAAAQALAADAHALDFVRLQYRHCKPILAVGKGALLLAKAQVPARLPDGSNDPGLVGTEPGDLSDALVAFKQALADGRVWQRETDPPAV